MAATVRSSSTYASAATEASFSMPLPSGFAAGDVCYIFAEDRAATGSLGAAPSGWTAVAASFNSGSSTSSEMAVYRKVMTGAEGNPTVTGTSGRFSAVCVAVQGADNGTPEDVSVVTDGNGASSSTTITSPGLTPAASNDLLLIGFGCGTPAAGTAINYSTPSGMTLVASIATTVASVTESGMMVASLALTSNAATGTEATTITPSAVNGQTVTIAVRSAAAGGGPTLAQPGQTWLRLFHHRQQLFATVSTLFAVALAEAGAADDSGFAVTATVPLAESGTGADTLAVTAAVPLADSGAGTDTLSVSATVPLADSGSATDTLAVTATVPLAESGTGSDTLTVSAAVPLAEGGTGTVTLSVNTGGTFAVARSAPTVTDPRDGTATTAAAVTSVATAVAGVTSASTATAAVTSTPTVTDPRDGTAGVT